MWHLDWVHLILIPKVKEVFHVIVKFELWKFSHWSFDLKVFKIKFLHVLNFIQILLHRSEGFRSLRNPFSLINLLKKRLHLLRCFSWLELFVGQSQIYGIILKFTLQVVLNDDLLWCVQSLELFKYFIWFCH